MNGLKNIQLSADNGEPEGIELVEKIKSTNANKA
jgi:hypothetical protein